MKNLLPDICQLPGFIQHAEGQAVDTTQPDLQAELEGAFARIRDESAPLAFLYDLRVHGGLAHAPNSAAVAMAAKKLGLATRNWHRTDYLQLLKRLTQSICRISEHLEAAARIAHSWACQD